MNRTEIRAALSLAFVYVLRMLGLFMIMPVIAVLAHDFDDYAPWLVGLAIGGYGLAQALLQIPMGLLSDRFGRKPIILGGLLIFALGSWLAASADSMVMLVVGRLLQGGGAIAGAIMALASDVSRESERSKVMAIIGIAIGFSFYLALLIGPIIADNFGLQGIFALTAVLALACMPLVMWLVPDPAESAPSGDTLPVLSDVYKLFRHGQLARLNFSVFLLHTLITLLFMQLPLLLTEQSLQLNEHWSVYLPVLLISVFAMGGLMRLSKKLGQASIIQGSILLMALVFAGMSLWADNFWPLMVLICLFFTGFNFLEANFPALVSSIAPAGKKGSAMGIYASCQFLGAFAGGVISGLLAQYFLPESIFVTASVICLLWLAIGRGLISTELLKRYTLAAKVSAQNAAELKTRLAALDGVNDVTVVPDQQIVYLKVDSRSFSLRKAREVANSE